MIRHSPPIAGLCKIWTRWPIAGLLLVAALLSISACTGVASAWQAPEVALLGIQPRALGRERQVMIARLRLTNPNDRTLPVKALSYRLTLEGEQVAEGTAALDRLIPPRGSETVDVEVAGNLLDLAARLPMLVLRDRPLAWSVAGRMSIANELLQVPYRYSGEVEPRQLLDQFTGSILRRSGSVY